MKIFNNIICLAGFTFILASNSFAGSVAVPNQFQTGQKAVAADVNANFDAVEVAINDNDSKITANTGNISTNTSNIAANTAAINLNTSLINNMSSVRPVVKNGAGEIVGFPASTPNNFGPEPFLTTFSIKGYRVSILLISGGLQDDNFAVVFRSNDCTGSPLTPYAPGYVISLNNNIYYSPFGGDPVQIPVDEINSRNNPDGSCTSFANNSTNNFFQLLPNDPVITGASADMFTPPLSITIE